ncbi:MAG: O-antigen ligase family protein [Candidatus Paceibacterota bacterium]|jgi:O-antigen ligase
MEHKKISQYLLKAIRYLIYSIVLVVPLFYLKQAVYPYTFSKTLFFQILCELIIILWISLVIIDKKYRPKLTPIFWAFLTLGLVLIINSIFGEDPLRSFWGTQERALGVYTYLHFILLGLVISSLGKEISFKKVAYFSLISASIVSVIGLIQLSNPNFLLAGDLASGRPGSTFGNPSFLAGYLLFNIFFALYFLLKQFWAGKERFNNDNKNWGEVIFLGVVILLTVLSFFQTQTRGDIIGFGVALVALFGLFAFRPPEIKTRVFRSRKFYASVFILVIILGGAFWFTKGNSIWESIPGLNRFKDLSFSDQGLKPRIVAIESAWKGFLEKPILGWGFENFNIVSNKYYDPSLLSINYQETRFDKPHNLVLEYLVVGGVLLLLSYVFVLGALIYSALKIKDKLLGQVVIVLVFGYFIRNLFLFETIGPLIMFFVTTGFIDGFYRMSKEVEEKKEQRPGFDFKKGRDEPDIFAKNVMIGIVLLGGVVWVYVLNVNSLIANKLQYQGMNDFIQNNPGGALESFKKAIDIWSPYRWNVQRDYAAAVAENYFYKPEAISADEVKMAIVAMEEATAEHPKDAYNHYALLDMYNEVSEVNKNEFLDKAEKEGKIALELSPNRQQVMFSLAKTKSLRGDTKGAIELIKKALDLNPNVADGHFYYGLFAHVIGDQELSYKELKRAIELGRKWKNYHEPLVVANFFADSGHLKEAIELYKKSLEMEPGNPEVGIKLGIAYFFDKQNDLAREQIIEVMRKVDITKVIGYESIYPILRELNLVK